MLLVDALEAELEKEPAEVYRPSGACHAGQVAGILAATRPR